MKRYCVLSLISVCCLAAQDPEPPKLSEIRVTVLDVASHRPVDSATVTILSPGVQGLSPAPHPVGGAGETSFSLPRDRGYFLSVRAAGYFSATKHFTASAEQNAFTVTLGKYSKIQGQLVDADSGLPIEKLHVLARKLRYSHGKRDAQGPTRVVPTDKQGHFSLDTLEAGDYVIETSPLILTVSPGNHPDLGYPRKDWPGGGSIDDASPIRLLPGTNENLGTIKIAKRDLYRLTVKPDGRSCEQAYRVEVSQTSRISQSVFAQQTVRCGAAATFTALNPDSYDVKVFSSFPEAMGFAAVPLVRENAEVAIDLKSPAKITSRVLFDRWDRADDTARDPIPEGLSLKLFPLSQDRHQQIAVLPVLPPTGVHPDGTYEGEVYVPSTRNVRIEPFGLPKGYFLDEVRVNGRITPGPLVELDPYAPAAQVDFLFAPAARLDGTVHDCSCSGRVFAIPVPIEAADTYPVGITEVAAQGGRFTFERLRPGKYSIVAVADTELSDDRLEQPGRLLSLANSAKVIEIQRNQTTSVEVPLSVY